MKEIWENGECAIHSLSALFDGLDSIATQIATK